MRFLLVAIALASQACLAQNIPTNEEDFSKIAAERLNKELPGYNIQPTSKLTLEGKRTDGELTGQINLDRVYAFCARNAQNCSAALDQYAKGIGESVKERDRPLERGMVRLAIRPAIYAEQIRAQTGTAPGRIYARPVAPGLVAMPVLDFTRTVRFITDKDAAKLALTEDELFKLGEKNLLSSTRPFSEVLKVPGANSFGHISGEDYASSRILFHEDWRSLNTKLNNKLVVVLPAPDILLYGDGSTPAGVDALRTLAADVAKKSSRSLSLQALQWTESGWEVLKE